MTRRLVAAVLLAAALGALLGAGPAAACAVCYGAPEAPVTKGMNNAILFLLAVIGIVQVGFVAMFVSITRRARRLEKRKGQFQVIHGGVR